MTKVKHKRQPNSWTVKRLVINVYKNVCISVFVYIKTTLRSEKHFVYELLKYCKLIDVKDVKAFSSSDSMSVYE